MADAQPRTRGASLWEIVKQTAREWNEDNATNLGAALAYYAIFSIAPLFLLSIGVASFLVGEEAARGQLQDQLRGYLGPSGAQAVEALVGSAKRNTQSGPIAITVGVLTLLYAAGGVFTQLKESLNIIWGVKERRTGVWGFLFNRIIGYVMVLLIGCLLIVAALASAGVTAAMRFVPASSNHMHLVDFTISFAVITLLFAIIYKALPDVNLAWKNVWLGAAVTSVLYSLGKMAIGLYLARGGLANSYGAAGSIVVLMVWVYYSSQIVFFGAEFTQVYTKMRHLPAEPSENAVLCSEAVAEGEAELHAEKATALNN